MKNLLLLSLLLTSIICQSQTIDIPISPGDSIKRITITTIKKIVVIPPVDTTGPLPGYIKIFQSGYDKQSEILCCQTGNGSLDLVTFKTGPGSFNSRPARVSSGNRSEIQYSDNQTAAEGAIVYKVMYRYIVRNNCHSFQFHPNDGTSSALLALWHIDGRFVVRHNNGGSNISQQQPTRAIQLNTWYTMRVEYKFSTSGYYRWYIDDQLYASYTGPLKNGNGQYLKIGFNGAFDGNNAEAERSNINYDDVEFYRKQ